MLQIDHYQGTYGPIIWLDVDSALDLARLREVFDALAAGSAEIELCSALASRVVNLRELRLRLDEQRGTRRGRLVRTSRYERGDPTAPRLPSFVWSDSRSGWSRRAGLVGTLLRHNDPGRRDLTVEGSDGALVELSFSQTPRFASSGG